MGSAVGGEGVGLPVGDREGALDGLCVGDFEGALDGSTVGAVGLVLGMAVGAVGRVLGVTVGPVGARVGMAVGSLDGRTEGTPRPHVHDKTQLVSLASGSAITIL